MWKGTLTLPSVRVPVKLYAAVQDRTVRFRLLHDEDEQPVTQRMVEPSTNEIVPLEETRRGYPIEDDAFVVLDPEELEALAPADSRDIEVLRFVPRGIIDLPWYDRPYYLGPDGDPRAYVALAEALSQTGREGVVRWVMRKKSYIGSLVARDGHLAIVTLRHPEEVIPASALPRPRGPEPTEKEQKLARQLVAAFAESFDPTEYEDAYRHRVLELVETKARGGEIEAREPVERQPAEASLTRMLEASLRQHERKGGKHVA